VDSKNVGQTGERGAGEPHGEAGGAAHWRHVHTTRDARAVSWFQTSATGSLALLDAAGVSKDAPVVDVGAGGSVLVDELLARGYTDVTLLDIADEAFAVTRARLGERANRVRFVASDITAWTPDRRFALWHDRAVFHFLTRPEQRAGYLRALEAGLAPGARVVVATFALDGPDKCSGLPVQRYSAETLAAEFRGLLRPCETRREIHRTPGGAEQAFTFVLFALDR
jgi:SAM-dependent methyltransferase